MKQNIYDNEEFFSSYKALRETDDNYNVLLEQPAMMNLLPNLKNKLVLDLGCGFGDNCKNFINKGAKSVVGIDISQNMLELAKAKNSDCNIDYKNMPLENLSDLNGKFDFIYSSL
ncbi:MAG: class I SAM-dependent methyltransferase, partial [Eubacterium sp.]|nr:class I SAM-dependent methyltransferase [Eubacterium sp.]